MILADKQNQDWFITLNTDPRLKHISAFLDARRFTASDTGLTRRQLAALDADNLLSQVRGETRAWRRFSLKELAYIGVILQLKTFGFQHSQLKHLWQAFFGADPAKTSLLSFGKFEGEYAMSQVFVGNQILFFFQQDGFVVICDSERSLEMLDFCDLPCAVVHFNSVFAGIWHTLGLGDLPVTSNVETLLAQSLESHLSAKEKQLLSIIRNSAYSEITMTKKDKGKIIVRAGRVYDGNADTSPEMILERLTTGDFKDVSVKKRNGSIVSYTEVTTFKI